MKPMIKPELLIDLLGGLKDPLTGRELKGILKSHHIKSEGSKIKVNFPLGYKLSIDELHALQDQASQILISNNLNQVELNFDLSVRKRKVQAGLRPLDKVSNIIAVASGKGGVGKSTCAVNIAIGLAQSGANVGLLDADIYGPSVPILMGLEGKPEINSKQMMIPHFRHGIWTNSFGFLIGEDEAAIWRGPMVVQALNQLISFTDWPQLDYLIVDMPPGTGDIALSMSQKIPVVGAVIITTPQDLALLDVKKGVAMFEKVGVPILGVIENMATYTCPKCGHTESIFGHEGGLKLSNQMGLRYLGALPLNIKIREGSDAGIPITKSEPESQEAKIFRNISRQIAISISSSSLDMTHKLPPVVLKS
ncbi:iron-sulfur cluster carrier protein ApbC [Taylorella equigenitalis]|uniref:iron-sulfur cluster carrier protein ApbC n=1 Tax=Taylorella equigenitalis TaxID=29575 RepID=UPI0004138AD1|nr:iron-sulfur cluster carrier protein ApbC [Taylorella equigenitalis]ASY37389.1 iron-sulfur cluster carrier protein ApbC [Taylorella equigenitalis]ASY41813.1 ATP-binding protein [Taylorella equigenitalis]KGK33365.1 ATP-binding protein [Taylorella equigenitalis]RBA25879.1 iron-sulfur cluster carrier protein ApbC [Taylorella equigenitalis]WDU46679.1 iron-sulfur cluster carrier protein ApbC [Taylorella equigenitalis]